MSCYNPYKKIEEEGSGSSFPPVFGRRQQWCMRWLWADMWQMSVLVSQFQTCSAPSEQPAITCWPCTNGHQHRRSFMKPNNSYDLCCVKNRDLTAAGSKKKREKASFSCRDAGLSSDGFISDSPDSRQRLVHSSMRFLWDTDLLPGPKNKVSHHLKSLSERVNRTGGMETRFFKPSSRYSRYWHFCDVLAK